MIPYQQRGVPISPSAFNQLVDLVRSSLLTAVTGGTFIRTPSGTSINIAQATGGASSDGQKTPCAYFEVTDASDESGLKVEVAQNLIAGRWPDGMGLGFPPFKLDISGNAYIYAKITYNTTTLQILPDSDAITILQAADLQPNTEDSVYILLATAVTGGDPLAITQITNVCTQPVPNPCLLAWSNETSGGGGSTPPQ